VVISLALSASVMNALLSASQVISGQDESEPPVQALRMKTSFLRRPLHAERRLCGTSATAVSLSAQ